MYGMVVFGGIVNYSIKCVIQIVVSVNVGLCSDSVLSVYVDVGICFGDDDSFGVWVNVVKEDGDIYLDNGGIDCEIVLLVFDVNFMDLLLWIVDLIYSDCLIENFWNCFLVNMVVIEFLFVMVSGSCNLVVDGIFDGYKNLIVISSLKWNINDNW